MNKKVWKIYQLLLVVMMLSVGIVTPASAKSNKKVKLSAASVSLNVGSNKTVKLKNASGKIRYRVANKKIASVSRSQNVFTINGKKAGKTSLKLTYKKKSYTCSITVNAKKKATSGKRKPGSKPKDEGIHSARVYSYTGVDTVDYMTEIFLQRAGVQSSQSDDEIVQRIYAFLAKNWRYPYEEGYQKQYFNADDLEAKSEAYGQKTQSMKEAGEITFDDKYAAAEMISLTTGEVEGKMDILSSPLMWMTGVCDYNSAAFTVMCNHAGIVSGKAGGSVDGVSHAWSWAIVNGKKYYYDPGFAIHTYYASKKVNYDRYKMKRSAMNKSPRYIFDEEY